MTKFAFFQFLEQIMKITEYSGGVERRVLIGMITDSNFLARIFGQWDTHAGSKGLFYSDSANHIGRWCIDYYSKYGKAPKENIESRFEAWEQKHPNQDETKGIAKILSSLDGEYDRKRKKDNTEYLVDMAGRHFTEVLLSKLSVGIAGAIDAGNLDEALESITKFQRPELGAGSFINPLRDEEAMKAAFESENEILVEYDGALGIFFGDALSRDCLFSFMGPEKRGKTWWLIDLAWRAMLQHRRVAFFEVGDMTQNQMLRRLGIRAAKHPRKGGLVKIPKYIRIEGKDVSVKMKKRVFDSPLTWKLAYERSNVLADALGEEDLFRLSTHSNSSISVNGIHGILKTWDRQGWTPDVIVIDYADILAPINPRHERRVQVDETWKGLRRLGQDWRALTATATQSDAQSYHVQILDKSNFSESKTKLAHATGIAGINCTIKEKDMQLNRLNWVVLREGEFAETDCVYVAGCLSLAAPAIVSAFQ